jgi:hypothetical protein
MTAREFAERYARNSGHDVVWFDQYFEVWTCHCGAECCRGFRAMFREAHPVVRNDAMERGEHPVSLEEPK